MGPAIAQRSGDLPAPVVEVEEEEMIDLKEKSILVVGIDTNL